MRHDVDSMVNGFTNEHFIHLLDMENKLTK